MAVATYPTRTVHPAAPVQSHAKYRGTKWYGPTVDFLLGGTEALEGFAANQVRSLRRTSLRPSVKHRQKAMAWTETAYLVREKETRGNRAGLNRACHISYYFP